METAGNIRQPMIQVRRFPLLLFSVLPVLAQKPVISPNGVVNAASLAGADQPGWAIAPGAIVSIFGENLARTTRSPDSVPLPRELEGTSVSVAGLSAPLLYVSPTQVNFQAPSVLMGPPGTYSRPVPVVVTTAAGVSEPVLIPVALDASGIFTQTSRGCGQGVIQNIDSDGGRTLNTPDQSASPGSFVSVYGTGLGIANFSPPDGQPAQRDPPARTRTEPVIRLGPEGFARQAPVVTYSGRAPGLIGVDQVDVQIPDTAPEGCAVPLRFWTGTQASQPVVISVHRGGGTCQDAPLARFGSILWQRKTVSGPEGAVTINNTFTASFSEAPSNQVAPQVPTSLGLGVCSCPVRDPPQDGPRCPGTGLRGLDVGPLTIKGVPETPITVNPSLSFGEIAYTAALPPGSVQPGAVQVEAAGGAEVGAFQTSLTIPPPIQITTPLSPGTIIPDDQPFTVRWTGGSPEALVRMQVISENTPGTGSGCECRALVSDGQVTLGLYSYFAGIMRLLVPPRDTARVTITVTPRPDQAPTFSAPGLTRDATHEWSYEYSFAGLQIRSR